MSVTADLTQKLLTFNRYVKTEKGKEDLSNIKKDVSVAEIRLSKLLEQGFGASPFRKEFALGGKALHRGPLSPDLLKCIILSKIEKGKLVSSPSKNSSFSYGFSEKGRLVTVSSLERGKILTTEQIFYKKDAVFGIIFSEAGEPVAFSEEIYKNGLLIRYSYYTVREEKIVSARKTVFGYTGRKISKAYELKLREDGSLFRSNFLFLRTSSGYLRSYRVYDLSENGKIERQESPFSLPPYLDF